MSNIIIETFMVLPPMDCSLELSDTYITEYDIVNQQMGYVLRDGIL